ncbi:MAG TPA: serine hydrolase [Gemmatimonadaceae bacterium]|nr:serine hydrolase [Gemmatimonadaceae bacterium]
MIRFYLAAALGCVALAHAGAQAATPYVPPPGSWERRTPEQMGMDGAKLQEAIAFAKEREVKVPRDLEAAHYQTFGREPFGNAVGPMKSRGEPTGIIVRRGYIVAEWGEPARVDMTHSVTKSFVSTSVGLAVDRGMIRSIDDSVYQYMAPVLHAVTPALRTEGGVGQFDARTPMAPFETPHNRKITWRHLLQQTSDWEGTLWGKPDWADRPTGQPDTWLTRARAEPGATYEYNDTRVNALALASLNVWRRPLPQVLRELVMDPIGASPTWRWYGYDNSWIVLDGQMIQSVSGGGHWGGGMFISAYDQARFGLLTLRNGRWGNKQLISESWIRLSRTPTPVQPDYGFMNYFLNTGKKRLPSAAESVFFHLGNGTNAIICDPENDLVVVARWIDGNALDGLMQRVLASLREAPRAATRGQ